MDQRKAKELLNAQQQRLEAFMKRHPELLDELFRCSDARVRQVATTNIKGLGLGEATLLCDRARYLTTTRIVYVRQEAPRCGAKVIYDQNGAERKANQIWRTGRGRMRVYACPRCQGYHLTHKAHKDADQKAA